MFINSDYRNWHLFYLVKQKIQNLQHSLDTCVLLIAEQNKYIENYINDIDIACEIYSNIDGLDLKKYSNIFLLKPILGSTISFSEDKVQNLHSDFENYMQPKIPNNYIIDEFESDDESYSHQMIQKEKIAKEYIAHYSNNCIEEKSLKLFNKVEIETLNRCNNNCGFCPVSHNQNAWPLQYMSKELFDSIINQLAYLDYNGTLSLFSNNEPLLDDRLLMFAEFARKKLPKAYIYLYTNGILLTLKKLITLLKYIDHIHINNYNMDRSLIDPIQIVHQSLLEMDLPSHKVTIHLRNINQVLSTRGGESPNKPIKAPITCGCILPFSQLIIRPDGKVSFCCNDVLQRITLGDLAKENVIDVWHNELRFAHCNELLNTRKNHPLCKKCDFVFLPLNFEKQS